jgi:anti-sigma B factor antagonist
MTPAPFELVLVDERGLRVLEVRGELDVATAPLLAEGIDAVRHGPRSVVIDLRGVTFADHSGIAPVLPALTSSERGDVTVRCVSPAVARVLEAMGVGDETTHEPNQSRGQGP